LDFGLAAAALLCLAGCTDLKGYGVSRWPLYRELPDAVELTDAEKAQLKATLAPKLLERVKAAAGELAYYREIVRKHNDAAAEKWLKIEKGLGADDDELKQLAEIMKSKIGRSGDRAN
jgi:hypothetical protein